MNNISEHTIFSLNQSISIVKNQNDGAIIFNPDNSIEKYINPVGLKMLEMLIPDSTILNASRQLAGIYKDIEERQILSDLKDFYKELMSSDFIKIGSGEKTAPDPRPFPALGDAPKIVDIAVTGKCNLRCPYCFYDDDMRGRNDIPLDQWLTFFYEVKRAGVRNLVLSGGEVFLRQDLWELIDGVVDIGLRFSLLSNGTLIDEYVIHHLGNTNRLKRLNSIQISIDGSGPEVHDRIRGKGSFQRSVKGLKLLLAHGFPVTVRVTVNRLNVHDLENIAKLLLVNLNLPMFSVNDALAIGAACGLNDGITLTVQQQYDAMKRLAAIQQNFGAGRVQASAGPLARWHYFQEMEESRAINQPKSGMGYLSSCGCASVKLAVHHDGTMAPCNMLTGLTIGEINKDVFANVWRHHPVLKQLRDRRKIPIVNSSGCEDCEWSDFCKGGCPAKVFHDTGDLNRSNLNDCYRLFLLENNGRKPWLEDTRDG